MSVPIYVPTLKTILKALNRSYIFVTYAGTTIISTVTVWELKRTCLNNWWTASEGHAPYCLKGQALVFTWVLDKSLFQSFEPRCALF